MLADDEIERYARQIVVPGIGAAGQQRLLASTVAVIGDERGLRQAALYLRAAGAKVLEVLPNDGTAIDIVLVAGTASLPEELRGRAVALGKPVCWYTIDDEGFTSAVHPESPLPASDASAVTRPELHAAAACDAAAVACAIILGLPHRRTAHRFDC